MTVRSIDTRNPDDVSKFIQVPFDLFHQHPYWVPPLRREMKANLDQDANPFFQHSSAAFFIYERDHRLLGRVAAIHNTRYNQVLEGPPTGFFYYFDAVSDPTVSAALFQAAFKWARSQGLEKIYGPKGLLQGDGIGLLVDGFDHLPAMGIPYNYPYYAELVEASGFRKVSDYYSGYLKASDRVPERIIRIAEKVKNRRGFWVKKFTSKGELLDAAPQIRRVYNAAFASGEGFSPISESEMKSIASRMLSIADPRLIKLIYKESQLVGFLFAYPNIGRGLQRSQGRLWPLGWLHLWLESKTTSYLDMNGIGLHPDHQGVGATAVLYQAMENTFRDFNFDHVETVQIREDNSQSMAENTALNVTWYKTHRVYERKL